MSYSPSLSVGAKVQAAVLVGVVALLGVGAAGVSSAARINADAHSLYTGQVRPLETLADLRDAEGDLRVAVRDHVLADTPDERTTAAAAVRAADTRLDADLDDYLAQAHPPPSSARS